MVQVSATSRRLVHRSGFRASIRPRHNKAARRRLCADYRWPRYRQHQAIAGTILVAATAEIAGVVMV